MYRRCHARKGKVFIIPLRLFTASLFFETKKVQQVKYVRAWATGHEKLTQATCVQLVRSNVEEKYKKYDNQTGL